MDSPHRASILRKHEQITERWQADLNLFNKWEPGDWEERQAYWRSIKDYGEKVDELKPAWSEARRQMMLEDDPNIPFVREVIKTSPLLPPQPHE